MEAIATEQLVTNVIGGEERASSSTETLPVQAPATGEVIGKQPARGCGV